MNDSSFRTRNPWLVVFWSLGLMVLLTLPQVIFVGLKGQLPGWVEGESGALTLALGRALLALIVGIGVTLVVLRFLWRRSGDWICLSPRPTKLLPGIFWGTLAPLLPLAILLITGVAEIERAPLLAAPLAALQLLAAYLLFWLYAAGAEEIVFRGMIARELAARLGWIRAWLIGGAVFGLVHYQPGYGLLGALWLLIGGILVSGLFIALYVRGRTLWLPIGFHVGWNFCMTNLVGAPMSGRESSAGLFRTSVEGHTLLTGGDFGIEISFVTLLFYGIYAFVVLKLPRGEGDELLSPDAPTDPLEPR